MDPHWLYADPQKLMNGDPDPDKKNRQIVYNQSFKSREKNIFNSVPKPFKYATFLVSELKKYHILQKKTQK